ncbi:MAG: hypothetical protein ABL934_16140 [Lysobacteraceae bacterium]
MRRSRFLAFALLLLAMVSLPVAARTSPLSNVGEDTASCPDADAGAAADEQEADPASKSTVTKRTAAPAATKTHPTVRGNGVTPGRAPRWHRFLPGMYR